MIRGMTVLWAVLAITAGIAMFLVKYEVQALEEDLRAANHQIRRDREQIHVLQAEWAYLNEPSRLRALAEKHLNLHPLEPTQVITLASLPQRPGMEDGREDTGSLVSLGPDGTPAVPWASYPLPKPRSDAAQRAASELASTRVSP